MKLHALMSFILNGIYPPHCVVCQCLILPGQALCKRCGFAVVPAPPYRHWLSNKKCLVVHAASAYRPPLDRLVRAKKHSVRAAAVQLGTIVAHHLQQANVSYDLLIPVPLHWSRYLWRGYNQAHVMASVISQLTIVQMAQPFLRSRYTQVQRRLSRDQRFLNVGKAFGLRPCWQRRRLRQLLAGKRVLLIDDVFTTGATLSSLAQCVWKYGPKQVHAAVACRVLD